jgi:hypothetical protein
VGTIGTIFFAVASCCSIVCSFHFLKKFCWDLANCLFFGIIENIGDNGDYKKFAKFVKIILEFSLLIHMCISVYSFGTLEILSKIYTENIKSINHKISAS